MPTPDGPRHRKVTTMTTAPITQVTAPMPTRRGDGPALPTRRPLTLARVRRARRRVTYQPRLVALPLSGVLAGGAGIVALTLTLCGAAWWL